MFYPIGSMQSLFEALLECSREDFFIIFLLCSIFFFALAAFLNYEYSFNHVNHKRLEFRYYAAIVIAAVSNDYINYMIKPSFTHLSPLLNIHITKSYVQFLVNWEFLMIIPKYKIYLIYNYIILSVDYSNILLSDIIKYSTPI